MTINGLGNTSRCNNSKHHGDELEFIIGTSTYMTFPMPCWNFRRALNSRRVSTICVLLVDVAVSPLTCTW